MELLGALLGGIGLFLVGIKGLGTHLQSLAGRRMRAVAAQATRGPLASAATGLVLGGLTQSSNAVTFILTALVQSGVLSLRQSLPLAAFANPGTAGLVLLATVDIHLAVLWVIGLVGLMGALNLDRDGRLRPVLGALFGLALMFLGLDLVKEGAATLRELRDLTAFGGVAGLALPFLAGAAVTLLAQSSSTVSILAMTLHAAGVIGFEQAALAVCGASLGSGGAVLLLAAGLRGAARRLAMFQSLLKAAGALLFLALLLFEHLSGWPLLLAGLAVAVPEASSRIGVLFLLLQLASALIGLAAPGRTLALLARLCPDSPEEQAARPRYLYDRALDHPPTALDLAAREQLRLARRLQGLIDPLRAEPERPAGEAARNLAAGAALEHAIAMFLAEAIARAGDRQVLGRAVTLEAANAGLAALRETLGEFTATAASGGPALREIAQRMAEALHLLLGQLAELAGDGDAEDAVLLRRMADDRGAMMDGLRRRLVRDEAEWSPAARAALFAATAQFERAVWLVRRQALLLTE
ncbi:MULTISPECIES: Na/Pi symporter [Roseomonadaceae]|uniref:Na/Pi cotransporter family protein n=1 Tax=Falsiroseomonas oleicola TaxID=2801474 RepID=A0ABS6HDE0_9PROT|nr:Na/Pi symporter [Roseomonas oleicola]MBU8546751.1 Na/Pi cotransporter family protein [Roseomonas oleicola]